MLVARINKETTDLSRIIVELDEFLDPSEVVTAILSADVALGTTGWALQPFPDAAAPPPYDPTPLLFYSYTMDATNRKLIVFVQYGTPGNVYTATFVLAGTSVRNYTLEIGVQVRGTPPQAVLPVPVKPSLIGLALPIAGGTMLGSLYLFQDPQYPTEAATKHYVDTVAGITGGPFLSLGGGLMTGPLLLFADPVAPGEAATKNYVDTHVGQMGFLPLSGGQMQGDLSLAADPHMPLGAATKQYVDSTLLDFVPWTGGGPLTGALLLHSSSPVASLEAASKGYVDAVTGGGGPLVTVAPTPPPAPFQGQLWFDAADPNLFVSFTDASSTQWVIAVNSPSHPPIPFSATPPVTIEVPSLTPSSRMNFVFPSNPTDGQIVTSPGGQRWQWSAADQRWHHAPHELLHRTGDTMTGVLTLRQETYIDHPDRSIFMFREVVSGTPKTLSNFTVGADYAGSTAAPAFGAPLGFVFVRTNRVGFPLNVPLAISHIDGELWVGAPRLNMDGNPIVGLPTPTAGNHAVNRQYVDAAVAPIADMVRRSGDTMTGTLDISPPSGQQALRVRSDNPVASAIEVHGVGDVTMAGGGFLNFALNGSGVRFPDGALVWKPANGGIVLRQTTQGHPALLEDNNTGNRRPISSSWPWVECSLGTGMVGYCRVRFEEDGTIVRVSYSLGRSGGGTIGINTQLATVAAGYAPTSGAVIVVGSGVGDPWNVVQIAAATGAMVLLANGNTTSASGEQTYRRN